MTTRTRRRVFLSALVLALTLPAETILLRALQEPSTDAAVRQWARSSIGASSWPRPIASRIIRSGSRREIMRALSPERRAAVWQNHIARYVPEHPELESGTVSILKAAQSVAARTATAEPTRRVAQVGAKP